MHLFWFLCEPDQGTVLNPAHLNSAWIPNGKPSNYYYSHTSLWSAYKHLWYVPCELYILLFLRWRMLRHAMLQGVQCPCDSIGFFVSAWVQLPLGDASQQWLQLLDTNSSFFTLENDAMICNEGDAICSRCISRCMLMHGIVPTSAELPALWWGL